MKTISTLIITLALLFTPHTSLAQIGNVTPAEVATAWSSIILGLGEAAMNEINGSAAKKRAYIQHHKSCIQLILPDLKNSILNYCSNINDQATVEVNENNYIAAILNHNFDNPKCDNVSLKVFDYLLSESQVKTFTNQSFYGSNNKPVQKAYCKKLTHYFFSIIPHDTLSEESSSQFDD